MEKERKIKTLSLVALIVAVLGLTVAFAALSQTLTINGTASVDAAEWDIHFENVGDEDTYGDATLTLPSLSGTTLSNYAISVTKPGDYAAFEFDIVNNGTIDAQISNINLSDKFMECYKNSSNDGCNAYDFNGDGYLNGVDLGTYTGMINYGLYYVDTDKKVSKNDVLSAKETKRVKLVVEYKDDSTSLPANNFVIADGDSTITFEQAD